jgi:hypothetical protein
MSSDKHQSGLDRAAIVKAFQEMSDELGRRGITGELCLFAAPAVVRLGACRAARRPDSRKPGTISFAEPVC